MNVGRRGFGRDANKNLEEFWFGTRELEIAAEQRVSVALARWRRRRRLLRSQCVTHTAGEQLMEKREFKGNFYSDALRTKEEKRSNLILTLLTPHKTGVSV